MVERDSVVEVEPWGEDPKLVDLLGAPGAAGFRALFDGFPDLVGVLWAFGDGYMLGTFVQRSAKLGDGLVNFLTDITAQRRMEGELRSYADVVAHDLNEPIAGIAARRAARAARRGAAVGRRVATGRVAGGSCTPRLSQNPA